MTDQHWIGPFEWHGGERGPVPAGTMIRGFALPGAPSFGATVSHWRHMRGEFFYAADNAAGWLDRPDGWQPPDEAFPLEVQTGFDEDWILPQPQRWGWSGERSLTKRFRLLPRERCPARPIVRIKSPTQRDGRWVAHIVESGTGFYLATIESRKLEDLQWVFAMLERRDG